jgi:hypothetical protein
MCKSATEKIKLDQFSLHYHTKIKDRWYSMTIDAENAINDSVCCIISVGSGSNYFSYDLKTFRRLIECDTEYTFKINYNGVYIDKVSWKKYKPKSTFIDRVLWKCKSFSAEIGKLK